MYRKTLQPLAARCQSLRPRKHTEEDMNPTGWKRIAKIAAIIAAVLMVLTMVLPYIGSW